MRVCIIIPARFASSRFPGKVLEDLWGKPIIQHVYENAGEAKGIDDCFVATDDERIKEVVEGFGGKVIMTSPQCASGTDRVAEAAGRLGLSDFDVVVNVQGDEPLVRGEMVERLVEPFFEEKELYMATLAYPIKEEEEFLNRHVVKVVVDGKGFALYFSRAPIPGSKIDMPAQEKGALKHIGMYAYRVSFLKRFVQLPQGVLEKIEGLEQLRVLEHGYRIKVLISPRDSFGVDTPEELEQLRRTRRVWEDA